MSIATDLRSFLLADGTIAGLIGTRLYPNLLPQSPTFPAMTFGWVSGNRFHHLDGAAGIAGPRVQFDCWALTYLEAEALFEALRLALDGFRGDIGGSPPTRRIQGIFSEGERDLYEDGAAIGSGSGAGLYRRSADFTIVYEEGT